MFQGIPAKGLEFFKLLCESEEFTSELGKLALAAGKLEVELIIFLNRNGIKGNYKKAPLGKLIKIGMENNLLEKNLFIALEMLTNQRNYFTHNLYALFSDLIDETILEKKNLLDSDVHLFIERAWQLRENLNGIAGILSSTNLDT